MSQNLGEGHFVDDSDEDSSESENHNADEATRGPEDLTNTDRGSESSNKSKRNNTGDNLGDLEQSHEDFISAMLSKMGGNDLKS